MPTHTRKPVALVPSPKRVHVCSSLPWHSMPQHTPTPFPHHRATVEEQVHPQDDLQQDQHPLLDAKGLRAQAELEEEQFQAGDLAPEPDQDEQAPACPHAVHCQTCAFLPFSDHLRPDDLGRAGCCGRADCTAFPQVSENFLAPLYDQCPHAATEPNTTRRKWVFQRWCFIARANNLTTGRTTHVVGLPVRDVHSGCVLHAVRSTWPSDAYLGHRAA